MKKFFILTLAAAALSLTACKNGLEPTLPLDENVISFSMSDAQGSVTRATTRAGFTGADTRIVARFQSDEKGGTGVRYTKTVLKANVDGTGGDNGFSTVEYYTGANTRYWDDAFGRYGQISVYAVTIPNSTATTKLTEAKLSGSATSWETEATPDNTIDWDVTYTTTQTSTTLAAEDLAYSNNIQDGGKNGRYVWDYTIDGVTSKEKGYPADNGALNGHSDGRLVFTQKAGAQSSDAGHFDKGHLMFKHSLSRLTVVLAPGTGFAADRSSATDFKFNKIEGEITSGNIQLLSFPVHGKLDLDAGSWTPDPTDGTQNILQMIGAAATSSTSTAAAAYNANAETYLANRTYSAQMLPGKVFHANDATNVMQFVIDDNTYYITEKMVYDALMAGSWYTSASAEARTAAGFIAGTSVTMTQGHNYTLTLTVNKTGIVNVTATLAPWVEVAGSQTVNNAHITLSLKTTGSTCTKDIDLYRLEDDNTGYDADQFSFDYEGKNWFGDYLTDANHKTTLLQTAKSDNKWTTSWYFESNKTYYHFRTVNKDEKIITFNDANSNETKDDGEECNDYFNIAAGPIATTDPHWGAPMQSTTTTWLKYDTEKGYEAHLHYAIGATESQIAIQELHMMSNINVVLQTPSDGGKVQLYKPAVAAVLYASAEEYNAAKETSLTDEQFAELTDEQKTKTAAQPAVGTVIKITRIAANGTVEMGRGVVTPTASYTGELTMTSPSIASASDYYETEDTKSKEYTYAVVPQSLSRNFSSTSDDDFVGIFIQTPDHNQYYVVKKLSEIVASSVSDPRNQTKDQPIKRWYPGHTYTYTFTITKKGIDNITATVADWVTVTGKDTKVDLES